MKRTGVSIFVNLGLLFFGSIMAFSGLLIQIKYHMGNHGMIDINNTAWGINYFCWSDTHTVSSICVFILIIAHVVQHWKWYTVVIKKRLFAKNTQVITLSVIFILVAVTGFIPLIIKLSTSDEIIRKFFIEIHDKLALILFIYLLLHVVIRFKWYFITLKKITRPESTAHNSA